MGALRALGAALLIAMLMRFFSGSSSRALPDVRPADGAQSVPAKALPSGGSASDAGAAVGSQGDGNSVGASAEARAAALATTITSAPTSPTLPAAITLAPTSPTLPAIKVARLRELVSGEPACKHMPLDDACLLRYLSARGMDVEKAAAMLRQTIAWRRSFGADSILDRMDVIRAEARTGKMFVAPFRDREGRPVLVLRPRMENTQQHEGNLYHLVYQLERAVASMAPGGPFKLFLMIDFKGYSVLNAPPMKTTIATVNILQSHYPERLGKAVLLDAPWLFSGAYRAVTPFIDPVTREKISFLSSTEPAHVAQLGGMVDCAQVERDLGGLLDAPHYDEESYFAPAADPLQRRARA